MWICTTKRPNILCIGAKKLSDVKCVLSYLLYHNTQYIIMNALKYILNLITADLVLIMASLGETAFWTVSAD